MALVKKYCRLYAVCDATRNAFMYMAKNKKRVHKHHLRLLFSAGVRTVRKLVIRNVWAQFKKGTDTCWVSFAQDKLQLACKTEKNWIKPYFYLDKEYVHMVAGSTEVANDTNQPDALATRVTGEFCIEKTALMFN